MPLRIIYFPNVVCLSSIDIGLILAFFIGSPVTRWASVAFGAGVGLGSAYTDCSRLFDSPAESLGASYVSDVPVSQVIFFFLTVF